MTKSFLPNTRSSNKNKSKDADNSTSACSSDNIISASPGVKSNSDFDNIMTVLKQMYLLFLSAHTSLY